MLIFIDESGDTGFKIGRGSSRYFILCLIVFNNDNEAQKVTNIVVDLKETLRKTSHFEFKFNKVSESESSMFFNHTLNSDFKVFALVFDKTKWSNIKNFSQTDKFFYFALVVLIQIFNTKFIKAKVRLDKFGEKQELRKLEQYLKRNIYNYKELIIEIKFKDSKKDVLIQLADMYAGLIRKIYEGKKQRINNQFLILKKVRIIEYK